MQKFIVNMSLNIGSQIYGLINQKGKEYLKLNLDHLTNSIEKENFLVGKNSKLQIFQLYLNYHY